MPSRLTNVKRRGPYFVGPPPFYGVLLFLAMCATSIFLAFSRVLDCGVFYHVQYHPHPHYLYAIAAQ